MSCPGSAPGLGVVGAWRSMAPRGHRCSSCSGSASSFSTWKATASQPKTKETRGAVKHIRYDFRSIAHVIKQLCLLEESPDELWKVEHLSPQQYLETFLRIDHSLINKLAKDEDNIVRMAAYEVT